MVSLHPAILLFTLGVTCGVAACASADAYRTADTAQSDTIAQPLTNEPGDALRGRTIVAGREGNCLLCHSIPETGERFMGNVGPPLSHVAERLTAGQMRLRIVDPTRIDPVAAMPAYYRVERLDIVAAPYVGKPILTAQQVEDVIAYLQTLH
jgi:L-cysteine S-thiosulfotransferase